MYVYIPANYPTRMRSLGTGWTDGIGHLGAWGGVLIAGQLFTVGDPRPFFLFITIPCALLPALLIGIFGQRPRAGRTGPVDAGPPARYGPRCCHVCRGGAVRLRCWVRSASTTMAKYP